MQRLSFEGEWNDDATWSPDGEQIAQDLHALLAKAGVPGPYVLAGHSTGESVSVIGNVSVAGS